MHDNMTPHQDPVTGTVGTVILAILSASFGFFEHADVVLGVVAKLVAIIAGVSSIILAYQTYSNHTKDNK